MTFPRKPIAMPTGGKELQYRKVSEYYGRSNLIKLFVEIFNSTTTLWDCSWVVPYQENLMEEILSQGYRRKDLIWTGENYSNTPVFVLPDPALEINSIKDLPQDIFGWKDVE